MLYRGLGGATGGTYRSGRSLRGRVCMADLVTVGVSASSSLSPSSVLSLLDRGRGAVSARELRVVVSRGVAFPSPLSSHRPPPPSPPGMNLRRLLGGSVVSSRRGLTRVLAGVRVGRRGECSVEAILSQRARWSRVRCGVGSGVTSCRPGKEGEARLAYGVSRGADAVQLAHGFVGACGRWYGRALQQTTRAPSLRVAECARWMGLVLSCCCQRPGSGDP